MFHETFASSHDNSPLNMDTVKITELTMGYVLPKAYIEVLLYRNGGYLKLNEFPLYFDKLKSTIWVPWIEGIGLGENEDAIDYKFEGEYKNSWKELLHQYGKCEVVVIIRAGRQAIFLDYSKVGSKGEPEVCYCFDDYPNEPSFVFLSPTFEKFVLGLRECVVQVDS